MFRFFDAGYHYYARWDGAHESVATMSNVSCVAAGKFTCSARTATQFGLLIPQLLETGTFGQSVAKSSNSAVLLVGAVGSAYRFYRDPPQWTAER